MEAMRALGRWPRRREKPEGDAQIAENNLAIRLNKAFKSNKLSEEDQAELDEMLDASREPTEPDQVMDQVRALGYLPRRIGNPVGDAQIAENNLARKFRPMLERSLQANGDLGRYHILVQWLNRGERCGATQPAAAQ